METLGRSPSAGMGVLGPPPAGLLSKPQRVSWKGRGKDGGAAGAAGGRAGSPGPRAEGAIEVVTIPSLEPTAPTHPPRSQEDRAALLSFPLEERTRNEIASYTCLMRRSRCLQCGSIKIAGRGNRLSELGARE